MAHKIGVQIQSGTPPDFEPLVRLLPRTVKLLGNALNVGMAQTIRSLSPQTTIVLRFAGGDQDYRKPASVYADEALRVFAPFQQRGLVDYVEHINEPAFRDKLNAAYAVEDARAMSLHAQGYARTMRANGYRTIAYNFSVGVPALSVFDGASLAVWPYLLDGVIESDALGLHEYSAPRMTDRGDAYCFRYRRVMAELAPYGVHPNLFITECGIDRGVIAGTLGGYRTEGNGTTIADYCDDLRWYAAGLEQDRYVLGAHLFLYGASDEMRWGTFDVAADEADRAAFFAFLQWTPSNVPPPPTGGIMPTAAERRDAAWQSIGFKFEPTFAFNKKAIELQLGRPIQEEQRWTAPDGVRYAFRGFDKAFLWCKDGDWGNIVAYDWLTGEPYQAAPPPPPPPNTLPPYNFPSVLTSIGALGEQGVPLAGQPFYRLNGAAVRTGISAFMVVTVFANGAPKIGAKVVNLFPDGNGEVIETDGAGQARFQFGASSAFSVPGAGPFTVFIADDSAWKDYDAIPKQVRYQYRLSDVVKSLGDWQGTHTEINLQFVGYQQ